MSAPRHVLALIPARSGSKGLPGKNIRAFHGRPLLHWTIAAARASGVAERVIVSTDDAAMAEIAQAGGAEIPFLRPPELARDETPMLDVALDALAKLEADGFVADALLLLQPTSPLRGAKDLQAAAALLGDSDAVVSVAPVKQHPHWLQRIDETGRLQPYEPASEAARRQDLPAVYALNGAIYFVRTEALRRERTFRPAGTKAYVMPPERSVDIDTEIDWQLAELLFSSATP
ncbi:MAG TPA: acylneuraminate cytidylyltransferase family protein [Chthoniobacteraceae bacterium]|jgi:CMP-N-acetylneuraminic acid synthetase|nr:acylneuraminate cytidylyltransferase family protein [Chthoniobacteraceae bacterium]